MIIEPKYEELNLKNKVSKLFSENNIECKTTLTEDRVKRVLHTDVEVINIGEEVNIGQIKYGGRAVFCIIYEAENGDILKTECGAEFNNKIDKEDVDLACRIFVKLQPQKTTAEFVNGSLVVKTIVLAEIEVCKNSKINIVAGGENLIVKKCEQKVLKSIASKKQVYPIEEEFELNYFVKEVLSHTTKGVITASQCGVGSVIIDGELFLTLCLLQNLENSDILKETKVIPFRLELELEDAMPIMTAYARLKERQTKLNIVVDEESGKSTVSVIANIELYGEAGEEQSCEIVEDAYSNLFETTFDKDDYFFDEACGQRVITQRVNGRCVASSSLEAGSRLMCVAQEKATLTGVKAENNSLLVDGIIECVAFCKDIEGKIILVNLETPFSEKLACDVGENNYEVEVIAFDGSAKMVALDSFDLNCELKFSIIEAKKMKISVISGLAVGEEKCPSTSAISVYIPVAGEELWSVSKRLNTCPEIIMELNKELQFPLSGDERIIIYRQDRKEY